MAQIVKHGVLSSQKVLFQVTKEGKALELSFFIGTHDKKEFITENQMNDHEWMMFKALAFYQEVKAMENVKNMLDEAGIETH